MARGQIELYMFEVTYHPKSRGGVPIPNETGCLPVQVIAAESAEKAAEMVARATGFPVTETTRLNGMKPPKPPRKPRQRKPSLAALGLVTAASLLRKDQS